MLVASCPIVEQAYEILALALELENFGCVMLDKFVVGGIISKLRPSLTDFVTFLKLKKRDFGIADFIGSLDVEEKARAKDARGKKVGEF